MTTNALDTAMLIHAYAGVAGQIPLGDAEALVTGVDHMDAVLPIIDPTAYRDLLINRDSPLNRRLYRAFLAFRREVEAIRGEIAAREAAS